MRVGIVTTWFDRGAAIVSRAYRDVLRSGGHDVFIYARGGEMKAIGDPRWDDKFVTWDCSEKGPYSTVHWPQFRRWVVQRKLDLLFFNEQHHWPVVVFARREFSIPIGSYVDYYTSRTVPLYGLFDFLICNTQRHASVFDWHRQMIYVPWGTDCRTFKGNCEPADAGRIVFFHSAGMNPLRKGTETALKAFLHLPGDCRFVLHVQASLSKFPNVAELAHSDTRIKLINETVGPPGLYHRGDVYVYPTILEGIGLTVMEALACGLPVITTGAPPMNQFVKDGVNGWLVAPAEYRGRCDGYYWAEAYCRAEDVRTAMERCLQEAGDLPKWKRRAREFAEANLDWAKNAAVLPDAFRQACLRGRNSADLSSLEEQALESPIFSSLRKRICRLFKSSKLARTMNVSPWFYCR